MKRQSVIIFLSRLVAVLFIFGQINSAWAAYPGNPPEIVARGGTGLTTITANYVLVGAGTSAIAMVAPSATSGIPLISAGSSADPAFGTALVAGGGTGLATITAHYTLVGAGTSAIAMIAPSATAGVPYISGGSSADPSFGTALPAGGGTGLATLTAHNVMLGEGTSNVAFAAPGATVGVPLISQNATTDPIFGTAVVAGGGTGVATIAANGVMVGEGTSAIHVVGTSSTADSVLAWAAAGADPAALAVNDCTGAGKALTYAVSSHTIGCNTITAGAAPTYVTEASSNATITLAATNLLTTVFSQSGTKATVINLPTAAQDKRVCIKDGTNDFAANPPTVKASGTIDAVAGATGIVMNITKLEFCFASLDGTNWVVE